MFESLKGYRTYICAALGGILVAASFLGFIDAELANALLAALGFGGLAALRASR